MTFESADTCMKVLDLLIGKLEDPSPVVKYKALNVIKNVLQKGSPGFFREIARKQNAVRECLNFRGPPDPLTGDTPYAQVRDMAHQVITMMYDAPPTHADPNQPNNSFANASRGSFEATTQAPPANRSNSMSSVSSSTYGPPSSNYRVSTTYAGSTSDGGRRVYVNSAKAIGSYVEYQPSQLDTFMDAVNEGIDSFKASILGNPSNSSSGRSYGYSSSPVGIPPAVNSSSRYTTGDVSALDHDGAADLSNYITNTAAPLKASHAQLEGFSRPTNVITEGWEYKLVTQLTPPNGRPAPARNEIADFVSKATQLAVNGNSGLLQLIEALLVRIITPDQWQCKLKAVYLLEAVLKGISSARDVVRPFLRLLREQSLVAVQASLSDKINAVIWMYPLTERPFDATTAPPTQARPESSPSPSAAQQVDLLGGASQPSTPNTSVGGGLFEGLEDNTLEQPLNRAAPVSNTPSLLDELLGASQPASSTPTPATSISSKPYTTPLSASHVQAQSSSLFEGLAVGGDAAPVTIAPAARGQQSSSSSLLLDFTPQMGTKSPQFAASSHSPVMDLEKDFFSKPATPAVTDPTATLRQLQPTSTYVPGTDNDTKNTQLAILRGRLDAVNHQIDALSASGPVATSQPSLMAQLSLQQQELVLSIQQLERATPSTSTTGGSSMSLEALYRQQPSTGTASIDYHALQASHPSDPFDAIRHDIRR